MTASTTGTGAEPPVGSGPAPADGVEPALAPDEEEPDRRRRRLLLLLLLLLLLALLLGLAIWYLLFRQPIPVPTIPGEPVMPSYVTAIYGAERPMGVGVDGAGDRVYVGETAGELTARVFDSQGKEVAKLLPPLSTGSDHVPVYVAVNPTNGEVYVSDRPTASIYVYDAAGTYQRSFTPPPEAKGWQPLGLGFDATGNLYVTDVGLSPNQVWVFDAQGNKLRTFGGSEAMNFPNAIALDAAGYAYVSDSNNGRLLVYAPDGSVVATVSRGVGTGNLGLPRGVAIDSQGRVYVVDSSGQEVRVYGQYQQGAKGLEYLGSFGTQGEGNGAFSFPNGIAVDGRGRLYVTDSGNNRVQLWSY
jgi:DNA-binding beta-propeller fold protein YncE